MAIGHVFKILYDFLEIFGCFLETWWRGFCCKFCRQDVEALQEQHRQAEEMKLAEEEKRRLHLERRKNEIEEEKRLIEELKQEQEEVQMSGLGIKFGDS